MPARLEVESQSDLRDRIGKLEETILLLQYQADELRKARENDPMEIHRRSMEIIRKSRRDNGGPHVWEVAVPGFANPVTFRSDTDNERAAQREYEIRFGTRFVTSNPKDSQNHKIRKVE